MRVRGLGPALGRMSVRSQGRIATALANSEKHIPTLSATIVNPCLGRKRKKGMDYICTYSNLKARLEGRKI